ncbi:MAG: hypothetical protein JXA23_00075 [Bacteroidales bacterium]|nr:hypothetical protein [Bacteroidales bacterium]
MRVKLFLIVLFSISILPGDLFPQQTTFGDLIPHNYLPSSIHPSDLLNCHKYFRLADSINAHVHELTGINPIPEYHCGNDTLSYSNSSIDNYVNELSPGSILARMIIDRSGSPVCCKVYMRGANKPDKEIADALSKLIMMPSYRNGQAIPTECRFLYDFLAPRTYGKKVID